MSPDGSGGGLVLVIEHEAGVAELERRYLVRQGFEVVIEADPGEAIGTIGRLRPDVVVLDLSAPATVPGELYRRVTEAAHPAPVVCLADAARPGDLPAVNVLTRPFGPRLLVAAVGDALRRRGTGESPEVLHAGAVTLDPRTRTVQVGDRPVALTATEFDLLRFLMDNPGRVFSREQLLDAAWGPGASSGTRTIDVHIAQLRAKLGATSPIRTVRGVGYAVDS